nr:autotransporter outer membrane beta-barrel domain-containing protein [Campylobacter novaezeelandiae]
MGGGIEKNHSCSSKKLVLSLVTISFLSSYSYADNSNVKAYSEVNLKSRSASVYQNTNTTINQSLNNTHTVTGAGNTLVIGSGGTIQVSNSQAVNFQAGSSTSTFLNQGTLQGGNNTASVQVGANKQNGVTIETFTNEGIIGNDSSRYGVTVWGTDGSKSTITNFSNKGTISSSSGEAIYLGNTEITTFKNEGTIKSNSGDGIHIAGGTTIDNFTNSGIITTSGTTEPTGANSIKASSGVKLRGYIKTFTNESNGVISAITGVNVVASTIDNFTNKGTIESTSSNTQLGAAINLVHFYGNSDIKTFTNEGLIKSAQANGIAIEAGNKIETFINKGTIDVANNGMMFFDAGGATGKVDIGEITIESGGIIKAGNNAINIDGSKNGIEGKGIKVESGGILNGGNAGIYIGANNNVNTSITVSGTIQGGNGGIINTGTIGQEGVSNQQHGITIENGGTITSTNGKGILNTDNGIIYGNIINQSNNDLTLKNDSSATITSGITNNGNGTIFINNQGTISKDDKGHNLTNNGSGSIVIEDWLVTSDKDGNLDTIVVGGGGKDNVTADNITIDESNLDLDNLEDISDVISGVDKGNIGNITTNGSGDINLGYDPTTGKFSKDIDLKRSISGATFRSLISTTTRRSTFIDNVMGNSMQSFYLGNSSRAQRMAMSEKGNLYSDASDYIKSDFSNASYGSNKEHSLFILPYASSQNVELSLNEESKGHTKGTIIGYSTLKDSGIYGVYAGYEDTKMSSTYFNINNRTYYAGLKYFNTLFTTSKGQEVYIKAQGKTALIKNDLTKRVGTNEAKAEPNSYAYGMSSDIGMNFIYDKDIFSPEIGLAYEGGYTEAFSMQDTIGQATVKGGERVYANYLNLFSTKTSLTWFRDWLPHLKTSLTLGAKFNINPSVKAKARFGSIKATDEFDLPRVQSYATGSFIIPLNEAFYFSLNYNGMFDRDGNTHTGYAQFNYVW